MGSRRSLFASLPQVGGGKFCLPCVGNPVDGLQDVHAAECGLVLDPASHNAIVQCGANGRVPRCGQCPFSAVVLGCFQGHRPSSVQCPHLHTGQRACTPPAGWVGSAGALFAGGAGVTSTSESESSGRGRGTAVPET